MVAPISVTSPSSTAGSSASCWALLKRWISRGRRPWRPPCAAFTRPLEHGAYLRAAGLNGALLLECRAGGARHDPRERRLTGSRRSVQDHRVRVTGLDRPAKRRVLAQQIASGRRTPRASAVASAWTAARPADGELAPRPRRSRASVQGHRRRACPSQSMRPAEAGRSYSLSLSGEWLTRRGAARPSPGCAPAWSAPAARAHRPARS